jgi:PII-like signaling protein
MRVLDGDQFLVRIFLGESNKWHHTPLPRALLERLRREGLLARRSFTESPGLGQAV